MIRELKNSRTSGIIPYLFCRVKSGERNLRILKICSDRYLCKMHLQNFEKFQSRKLSEQSNSVCAKRNFIDAKHHFICRRQLHLRRSRNIIGRKPTSFAEGNFIYGEAVTSFEATPQHRSFVPRGGNEVELTLK